MRIAVIEDNQRLAGIIRQALERSGLPVDVFASANEARYGLRQHDYAAAIVDRGLPDGDGLALVRELRAGGDGLPCLVLTARDAIHDRVDGLESGADDYLTKPFALEELLARVRAMLRRRPHVAPLKLQLGNLEIDVGAAQVLVAGNAVAVTARELSLLSALAGRPGEVVSHDALVDEAFGPFSEVTPNSLEVAIHRLRRRLREAGAHANVVNHRGVGYALATVASG